MLKSYYTFAVSVRVGNFCTPSPGVEGVGRVIEVVTGGPASDYRIYKKSTFHPVSRSETDLRLMST